MWGRVLAGGALATVAAVAGRAWMRHRVYSSFPDWAKDSAGQEKPDKEEVIRELNNYFFQMNSVLSHCHRIVIENSDVIFTPLPLPESYTLAKCLRLGARALGINVWRHACAQILEQQRVAETIYGGYRGVFQCASAMVAAANNGEPLPMPERLFEPEAPPATQEPSRKEFYALVGKVLDGIEESCGLSQKLMAELGKAVPTP